MISNSACLKGGATLFLTTLTRVSLPPPSSPFLLAPMRRMSRRTEALNLSALPPVVVSGLPNITPIFMRIWLMKITRVLERLMLAVSLRSACDISRACRPTWESPISPSISALGVSAATESTTTTSTAPERTSISVLSSACSPVSGCDRGRSSKPRAMSSDNEPVEIASTSLTAPASPMRITEPLPNWRSIWLSAALNAFVLFVSIASFPLNCVIGWHRRTGVTSRQLFHRLLSRCTVRAGQNPAPARRITDAPRARHRLDHGKRRCRPYQRRERRPGMRCAADAAIQSRMDLVGAAVARYTAGGCAQPQPVAQRPQRDGRDAAARPYHLRPAPIAVTVQRQDKRRHDDTVSRRLHGRALLRGKRAEEHERDMQIGGNAPAAAVGRQRRASVGQGGARDLVRPQGEKQPAALKPRHGPGSPANLAGPPPPPAGAPLRDHRQSARSGHGSAAARRPTPAIPYPPACAGCRHPGRRCR